MNGNIKKLLVLVGVPIIALFIMVGMASADREFHSYRINGVYKVTGFSTCNPTSPGIMEADYTFRIDGTGSISNGVGRSIAIDPVNGPVGSSNAFWADFNYTVTKEGVIEFDYPYPPGGLKVDFNNDGIEEITMDGGPSHGVISPDRKTITISCGPPVYLTVIGDPLSTPVWCVTTLSGMRIH